MAASSYEWEPPVAMVHSYGSPVSARGYRDPQVLADPTTLEFDNDLRSPLPARRNEPYGGVNPNLAYAGGRTTYEPFPEVWREQYCMCAPKTSTERRLLVTVVVLGVLCLALLATLASLVPSLLCSGNCGADDGGGGNLVDLLPFLTTRLQALVPT